MPHRSVSTFPTPRWHWLLPALVVATVATGCGSHHKATPTTTSTTTTTAPATTAAPTTTSTSTTTGAPTTTRATTTTVAALRTCVPAQLTVIAGGSQGAAGHLGRQYQLQNSSSSPCSLHGYPGLGLLDASGKPMVTTVVRQPGRPIPTVTLGAGGSAYFTAFWADATGFPGASCPASASLEITPPNDTMQVKVSGPGGVIQAYGGTTEHLQCGTITVTPVSATPSS